MNEEVIYRAATLKQESEEVEQNLNFVNEQINELENFRKTLHLLEEENGLEILAPLGKGVFFKAKKIDDKLFVDVGAGIVVKRTPAEARAIIDNQLKKFKEAKIQLKASLEDYREQFGELLEEVENLKKTKV